MSKPATYNHGDYCLRTSLYACTRLICFENKTGLAYNYMNDMERECKLSPLSLFPIKSNEYTWSRSDGLTRWLYDHSKELFLLFMFVLSPLVAFISININSAIPMILSTIVSLLFLGFVNSDPHKGLNGDQLRAYYLYLMLTKQKRKAWLHILGIVLRLGFTPSLMEHCIFKPQAYIALLYTAWKPLKYLSYPFFKLSAIRNLKASIESGTTNKITLLPTLKALGYLKKFNKLDSHTGIYTVELGDFFFTFSDKYIEDVYHTYFSETDNKFIGEALIKAMKEET